MFAAYKKDALALPIAEKVEILKEEMPEAQAFRAIAEEYILATFDFGWTLIRNKPVGVVFGVVAGPYAIIGDVQWFPWATGREKLETSAKFLSEPDMPMMWFTDSDDDKDFYVRLARMGIVRRIGTGYGAGRRAFFEVIMNG